MPSSPLPFNRNRGTTHSHICDWVASGRLSQCQIPSNVGMSATPTSLLIRVTKLYVLLHYLHLYFHHKLFGALNFQSSAICVLPRGVGGGGLAHVRAYRPRQTSIHSYGPEDPKTTKGKDVRLDLITITLRFLVTWGRISVYSTCPKKRYLCPHGWCKYKITQLNLQ